MTVVGNYWCVSCGRNHRGESAIGKAHEYFLRTPPKPDLSETPFRIYQLVGARPEPQCVISTDEFSLAEALLDLHKREGIKSRGIMYRPVDDQPGEWLVNPWA